MMRSFLCGLLILVAGCVIDAPRADNIGAEYVGAAYISNPLGEGDGYDADPLMRVDAFDCTTFVETVLAGGDVGRLNQIRYKYGIVAWENRNHFIETDWLTNNSDLIENVSREYGPVRVRRVTIDKRAWARVVHGMSINSAPVSVALEYIDYDDLSEMNNVRPLIVLFVVGPRDNQKLATDIAVVHMGFLLPGGKTLRHASTGRGVVDDDFTEYVRRRHGMKNNIGIALVKIK